MDKIIGMFLLFMFTFFSQAVTAENNTIRNLMSKTDIQTDSEFKERANDWRNGAIVYQVLVDRFAPPSDVESKRKFYQAPRVMKKWSELPAKGLYNEEAKVWGHEIEFWGGDLDSLTGKLHYLQDLGIDVLYLNPIFESFTNHKYDAWDYHKVDPAFGTRKQLAELANKLHSQGKKLVLDGVFNHMGRKSPFFQDSVLNPDGQWKDFFKMTEGKNAKHIGWMDVENLPELNLENQNVRDYIFEREDSVVQSYLNNEGIDGWRLDVACDLGFNILSDLTQAAHTSKPGSLVIGEIWNYPEEWYPAVDGVMNMHGRQIILEMISGKILPQIAADMWETMVLDSGMNHILKAWLIIDNHDTSRLGTIFPEAWAQQMARVLQFTLPGSPCLYYGSELGMTGGEDPEQRAPMRWDLVKNNNSTFIFHKNLISLRKSEPALRYGNFRKLDSRRLFAFMRKTNSVRETIIVVANPSKKEVNEFIQIRDGKVQNGTVLKDQFSDKTFPVVCGMAKLKVAPREILVLKAITEDFPGGYSRYDRVY
ncbi:MAG: glycoside hydrolase family 13 protein [Candidatus Riflebacteria bacterium]|nr:glycoside hydrolase family 13 protein [Candidatus Riflebacteria bacterium]